MSDLADSPSRRVDYTVEALAKGLRILALFSERCASLRLRDIVAMTGLPMPTVFRLVATLESEGYLERLADGAVRPNSAVLRLGFAAIRGSDLVQTSSVIMTDLFEATKQTVNLGVLSGDRVLYIARLQSDQSVVTENVAVGSSLPAVVTSMGKVLLTDLPVDELEKTLSAKSFAGPWGPNAAVSLNALTEKLAQVREIGYAVEDEELAPGLRSIAAPLRHHDGRVVAAVNVAVSARTLGSSELLGQVVAPLLAACARISRRLGFPS